MAPMAEAERRDFWEIAEDRYQTRSMILTSQLPVSRWHEQILFPHRFAAHFDAMGVMNQAVDDSVGQRGIPGGEKKGEK